MQYIHNLTEKGMQRMSLDEKSLIGFKRAAELEHMTKAAQELYISQSQLSRIIQDMERV